MLSVRKKRRGKDGVQDGLGRRKKKPKRAGKKIVSSQYFGCI